MNCFCPLDVTSFSVVPFLELENISKHFTSRRGFLQRRTEVVKAVDGVSLSIEKGEILGLVGESGCGKSTLSRVIMQLTPPTRGRVILDGDDLSRLDSRTIRRRRLDFQMIFQDPYASLNSRMTVFSTLAEALRQRRGDLSGRLLDESIEALMLRVGLEPRFARKYPHEFSGGQRQRIAVARALAPDPRLIIADEPVSALDVSIQSQILNLLRNLSREMNLTMLFISHDLSVVRYIADRIAVMRAGRVVEIGSPGAVFENPQAEYTRALLAAIPRIQF